MRRAERLAPDALCLAGLLCGLAFLAAVWWPLVLLALCPCLCAAGVSLRRREKEEPPRGR